MLLDNCRFLIDTRPPEDGPTRDCTLRYNLVPVRPQWPIYRCNDRFRVLPFPNRWMEHLAQETKMDFVLSIG